MLPPSETNGEGAPGCSSPQRSGSRRCGAATSRCGRAAAGAAAGSPGRAEARCPRRARGAVEPRAPRRPGAARRRAVHGVLYDGLGAARSRRTARAWVEAHVVIASALFGLVAAGDPIPLYRLSGATTLPGLALKAHWRDAIAEALRATGEMGARRAVGGVRLARRRAGRQRLPACRDRRGGGPQPLQQAREGRARAVRSRTPVRRPPPVRTC